MTFVSYAQFFEDVFLWRCFKDQDSGYYVDVGAAWPDVDSVTKAFYDKGWTGINIEPNADLHAMLCAQRPRDLNLNVAISDTEMDLELSFFQNAGLSTANQKIAEKHISNGEICEARSVKAFSLSTILSNYLPPDQVIDFLKIDVEGLERNVLEGADFRKIRPKIIVVESTAPMSSEETWEEWEFILTANDYIFAYFDGLNRFYISHEHLYLKSHFLLPVNLWDKVETHDSIRLRQENNVLKQQLEGIRQEITSAYKIRNWWITKMFRRANVLFKSN